VNASNAELCWRPDSRYLVIHDGRGMDSAPPDIVMRLDEAALQRIEIAMPDLGSYTRSTYPSFVRFAAGDTAVFTVPGFRDRPPRQKTFTYTLDLRYGRVISMP
jgi:hypothetical protein